MRPDIRANRLKIVRYLVAQGGQPQRPASIARACGLSTMGIGNLLSDNAVVHPWFMRIAHGQYVASTEGIAALSKPAHEERR